MFDVKLLIYIFYVDVSMGIAHRNSLIVFPRYSAGLAVLVELFLLIETAFTFVNSELSVLQCNFPSHELFVE